MAHRTSPSFTEELRSVAARLLEVHEIEIARAKRSLAEENRALVKLTATSEPIFKLPPRPPQEGPDDAGSRVAYETIVTAFTCNSEGEVVDFSMPRNQALIVEDATTVEDADISFCDEGKDGSWARRGQMPDMPGQINGHDEDATLVRSMSYGEDELAASDDRRLDDVGNEVFWQRSQPIDSTKSVETTASQGTRRSRRAHTHNEAVIIAVRSIWQDVDADAIELCSSRLSFKVTNFTTKRSTGINFQALQSSTHQAAKRCSCNDCAVMHPVGATRSCWNIVCLMFILYDLFMVPFQAFDIDQSPALEVFEWFLTVWWTCDVAMTFRTGYFIAATLEMRPRLIALHYAKTWLIVDLAIVALEWANRFAATVFSGSFLRTSRVFRTMRLTKLLRITKLQVLWVALQDHVRSNLVELCCTMMLLTGVLLLTIHWVGCLWYLIGDSRDDGWITYDQYTGRKDTTFWYVASLRWVISQLNGRTDLDERRNMMERLTTCTVGIVLSVVAHAVFISFITKTILDLGALVSEKTRRRQLVNEYLAENPLPPWLRSQVKRCLQEYKELHETVHEDKVLEILPKHLQTDLLYEVRAPVITQHQLFLAFSLESPWVMRYLCRKVVQIVSTTRYEVIFDAGDVCNRILFTDKLEALYGDPYKDDFTQTPSMESDKSIDASFSILSHKIKSYESTAAPHLLRHSTGSAPRKVQPGTWVCEPAIWSEWKNRGRLVAYGHGFLIGVQAADLAQALQKHPDAFALASLYAARFVAELQKQAVYQLSDVSLFDIQLINPMLLRITIESATSSPKMQNVPSRSPNLYCACKVLGLTGCDEPRFKTPGKAATSCPVWNHVAEVGLTSNQPLEFSVFDAVSGPSPDRLLGVARLDPDEFAHFGFQGDAQLLCADGSLWGSLRITVEHLDVAGPAKMRHVRSMTKLQRSRTPAWMRDSMHRNHR